MAATWSRGTQVCAASGPPYLRRPVWIVGRGHRRILRWFDPWNRIRGGALHLEGHAHLSWFYAPARALATLLSYLSGIPAGLLAPSLSVGAGFGQFIADIFGQTSAVPFAILGMCGYLAGVTQAPLTALVIVMEMTSQHADGAAH